METAPKYTVTEITRLIKFALEESFTSIWVLGEISDFKRHSSGHYYFTLKDAQSQLSAVMWRGKNMSLHFIPQEGMKVLAYGSITVFEKTGRYQLDVDILQPQGIGELQIAFEQLKARLQQEGLFEQKWKKNIPKYPETIGVVTSPTGAAIQDIISIITRRYPSAQIIVRPVKVQGEGAAEEIADAIDECNEYGRFDVLIVGRGGGSIEDLWPFNEEIVARAIFHSKIPIISAVGHEVDFTISDFVADLRAPTPSAAAELAVPDAGQELMHISHLLQRIVRFTNNRFQYLNEKVRLLESSRALRMPADGMKQSALQLDLLVNKLENAYHEKISNRIEHINQLTNLLRSYDPMAVLQRGYSITYRAEDDRIIRDSTQLHPGDGIWIQFAKGKVSGQIEKVN